MRLLKRISYIILIVAVMTSQIAIPDLVFGDNDGDKSLNDHKAELAELKKEYSENKKEQEATNEEIGAAKEQITKISQEREDLEKQIETLTAEIAQLEKDIIAKNEEMKNIVRYYQLSSTGEDAYLEYLFTSVDFTDFIYRMAIAEQLSDYNESLIDEYNTLITTNENKKEEASKKVIELEKKTKELEKKVGDLNVELKTTMEGAMDIEDEMKVIENRIKELKEIYDMFDCDYSMSSDECILTALASQLYDTKFYRPVAKARISSGWGYRSFTLNGKPYSDFHYGMDFSTSHGSKVYAAANGWVVATINAKKSYDKNGKNVCGGNKIYLVHVVDGKKYTTAYYHLESIKVKVGDVVTHNTVIGTVGGTSKEYWDNCSTGAHLHFQIATGHYLTNYMTYSGFTSKSFNPKKVYSDLYVGKSFSKR